MTLTIRIRTKGIEQINKKWKLFRKINKITKPGIDKIGDSITRIAKQLAPKFENWLSEGIKYDIMKTSKGNSLLIENNVRYAYFQESGFTPHFAPITPYAKRWLEAHSTGASGHKPGKKGYFYVRKYTPHIDPAIELVRPNITLILKGNVDAFLSKTFGGIGK